MTNNLGVQGEALEQAASSFSSHVDEYNSVKSRLQSEVDATESCWQGDAGNAFRSAAEHWQEASAQTVQSLNEIQEKIQTAGIKYSNMEQENSSKLNQIQANW
jgi:WXG100 family type VII secretion target